MFISNISKLSHKIYRCDSNLGKKLIEFGIPLLGRIDDDMIFAKTDNLKKALEKIQKEAGNE